ncbi:hypothetical protein QR680_009940 [Steinernema hermaphroditum]|uniref:Transmembrane protein 134 n=1 Tax=Steinernema hermaphroditum TaxID=289476 RepID=A0AA39IM62_9BILA|nr:hypothetical protein QR680_009940 [Steinernema hermaphroditum]
MTSFYTGHHRNSSAAQQLIKTTQNHECDEEEQVEIYTSPVIDSGRVGTLQSQGAGSECSSYYMPPNYVPPVKTRSPLRANIRVVIGSILLTLIGIGLLAFGIFVMIIPHNFTMFAGVNGWIFLIVGLLFFIPGFYHVVYISCTLCGRPGYSFDSLPTFNK